MLVRYKLDTRFQKIDQCEGPDQEAQKLGEEKQDEAGEFEHEGQLDEHGHGERQAEDQDLHAVALENAKAASFVDLGVHEAVQREEKGKQAAQHEVDEPLDGL